MIEPVETQEINEYSKWFIIHPKLGISIMDHLFNRLDGAYPGKWKRDFPNEQAIDNWRASWAETFEDNKITLEEIAKGLKSCRGGAQDWPPSIGEFIKHCRPTKAIKSDVAYYEAVAGCQARAKGEIGVWSHPAIFWAAVPLAYDLLNMTYSSMKSRWEAEFDKQMAKTEWEEIKKPILAIAPPPKTKEANREAGKVLKHIGASGMLKVEKEHTLWYRKILERVKNGDKTVTMIQRQFAQAAALEHNYEP